jgi:hypothetical protein
MSEYDHKAFHTEVKLLAEGKKDGTFLRTWCPICSVKGASEKTFTLQVQVGGILYNCYKNSCPVRGGFLRASTGTLEGTVKNFRKSVLNPYTDVTESIQGNPLAALSLQQSYGISTELACANRMSVSVRGRYVLGGDVVRLVMPVFSVDKREIGIVTKVLKKPSVYTAPKTMLYPSVEGVPFVHFPLTNNRASDRLVIVEDMLSAIRISPYTPACALLGTHLTDEGIRVIRDVCSNVVVALDADTWVTTGGVPKPLKMIQRLQPHTKSVKAVRITKDPKDMSEEQLQDELLSQCR